jgi:hypothetical protein
MRIVEFHRDQVKEFSLDRERLSLEQERDGSRRVEQFCFRTPETRSVEAFRPRYSRANLQIQLLGDNNT